MLVFQKSTYIENRQVFSLICKLCIRLAHSSEVLKRVNVFLKFNLEL